MAKQFIKTWDDRGRNVRFVNINYIVTARKKTDGYKISFEEKGNSASEAWISQEDFERLTGEYEGDPVVVDDSAYEEAI